MHKAGDAASTTVHKAEEAASAVRSFTGNTLTDNALGPITIGGNEVPMLGLGTYTPNVVEGINVAQGTNVTSSGTWKYLGVAYRLPDGLNLNTSIGSAHVTVEAGNTLLMGPAASISVSDNAGFTLAGTSLAHVTVTSGKSGPAAGDWGELDIYPTSSSVQNTFTYTDFVYGGGNSYGQVWIEDQAGITLNNATFAHTDGACDVVLAGAESSVVVEAGVTPAICNP